MLTLTIVNVQGIKTSGRVEVFLTICKILPLIIVPLCSIKFINADNIKAICSNNHDTSTLKSILSATLLSFWGFVGLEGGTSASDFVKNPKRTISSAMIIGTTFVTVISLVNTLSMFSVIHPEQLKTIKDPFAHVMRDIFGCVSDSSFGTSLQNFICITTFLMCIGSLNAWVLFSGQIARSSANINMMPKYMGQLNKKNAPGRALWIGCIGTMIILCILKLPFVNENVIRDVLDMSAVVYVVLYTMAVASYIYFLIKNKKKSLMHYIVSFVALIFCITVLANNSFMSFGLLIVACLTGWPVYNNIKAKL